MTRYETTVDGGEGSDTFYASTYADHFIGGGGADTFYNNAPAPGVSSKVIFNGGAGDDVYYLTSGRGGVDVIESSGLDTIISLRATGASDGIENVAITGSLAATLPETASQMV